jgi:hypothetical protein
MKLDRELQLQVLNDLSEIYPNEMQHHVGQWGADEDALAANVAYLTEHGLLRCTLQDIYNGSRQVHRCSITAKGMDFLADDGGLSAILGVVTVRIHTEQWRELLASKVEQLETVSHEERSAVAQAIRNLPAKAIEKVSEKMLDWAVDHAGDALPLLRMLLSQVVG